jgi:hypothetical protein
MRIARLSSAHALEKAKVQPDQGRLAMLEEMNQWTDKQEALGHHDMARIDHLLAGAVDFASRGDEIPSPSASDGPCGPPDRNGA